MSLRNQPYLPFYVDDYLSDEKLNSCSSSAQGVYVKIMCIFHKSEYYGGLLIKQKDKQRDKQEENFAFKFVKLLPFDFETILSAITELVEEGVLEISGDLISQRRMVKDGKISLQRSEAGKKGGGNPVLFKQTDKQENKQNPVYVNEIEFIISYLNEKIGSKYKQDSKNTKSHILARLNQGFNVEDFKKVIDIKSDQWLNNNQYSKYLRPQTLFGTNFESYLNEKGGSGNVSYPEVRD